MKKILSAILYALLIMALCACGKDKTNTNDEEKFYVAITQNCNSKIYGIHMEYYLGDKPIGGSQVINTDYSALSKGDILSKDFIRQDFPEDADLSTFSIEFYIMGKNGEEQAVKNLIEINAEYGKTYSVTISDDGTGGYTAEYIGEKQ